MNLLFLLIHLVVIAHSIYKDPPPYFTSFYCNLGPKTLTDSGTYSCPSPKVIQRADKYALAWVQFNRVPQVDIWFNALITSSSTTNLTSVNLKLDFYTSYTTKYAYMIVVIGYQPENTWIDLINIRLPLNQSDTEVTLPIMTNTSINGIKWADVFSTWSQRLGVPDSLSVFLTSVGTWSSMGKNYDLYLFLVQDSANMTGFIVQVQTYYQQILKQISFGVVVWKESAKPSNVFSAAIGRNYVFAVNGSKEWDLHVNFQNFGPSFDSKCFLMINYLGFGANFWNTNMTVELTNSTLGNYAKYKLLSTESEYFFTMLCIASTSTTVQGELDYYDSMTKTIFAYGNLCPVPTTTYSPGNSQCQKCSQMQCLDCSILARNQCTSCISGYGLTETQTCKSCFIFTNCIQCSSYLTGCTKCMTGYALALNNTCQTCSVLFPNCDSCQSLNNRCQKCEQGYGLTEIKQCALCQTLFPNCASCTNILDQCLACLPGFDYIVNGDKKTCSKCDQFYTYEPLTQKCVDLCGDHVVISDECDDGIGVENDGCSDQCKQEPNYTCHLYSATVSNKSVMKSLCSYNLNLTVTLVQAKKQIYQNSLNLSFSLLPFLYGMPGTTQRIYTQEELKSVFMVREDGNGRLLWSDPYISVSQISVNSKASKVFVGVLYNRNLRLNTFELGMNFSFLNSISCYPQFVSSMGLNYAYELDPSNAQVLMADFHSEDEYSQGRRIQIFSIFIGVMAALAFVVGLFIQSSAGLELALLCQFTYLSLFFYSPNFTLPFLSLNGLLYSTGYNLPLSDINFNVLPNNPPQIASLNFNPTNFSHNFNLMTVLYILPLIAVLPLMILKLKIVKRFFMIHDTFLENKWVDLILGKIWLSCVMFNLQYLFFGIITFYQDSREIKNSQSNIIIWFSFTCTILAFAGFILKPLKYKVLKSSVKQEKEKEEKIESTTETEGKNKQGIQIISKHFTETIDKISQLILKNYLKENHRKIYDILSINHGLIWMAYLSLNMIVICLAKESQVGCFIISLVFLMELILVRPKESVGDNLRVIYFGLIYCLVSMIRLINNKGDLNLNQSSSLSILLLIQLFVGTVWVFAGFMMTLYEKTMRKITSMRMQQNRIETIQMQQIKRDNERMHDSSSLILVDQNIFKPQLQFQKQQPQNTQNPQRQIAQNTLNQQAIDCNKQNQKSVQGNQATIQFNTKDQIPEQPFNNMLIQIPSLEENQSNAQIYHFDTLLVKFEESTYQRTDTFKTDDFLSKKTYQNAGNTDQNTGKKEESDELSKHTEEQLRKKTNEFEGHNTDECPKKQYLE